MTTRICRHPTCGLIIPATSLYCARHNDGRNQRPIAQIIYHDPRWRRTRTVVLIRDAHTCQLCGAPATTADHYPTPALQCVDPFDPDTCRALCERCSGRSDGGRARQGGGVREQPPALNVGSPGTELEFAL